MARVAKDAYKHAILMAPTSGDKKYYERIDLSCFYLALACLTLIEDGFGKQESFRVMLANIKGSCQNLPKLIRDLQKEGVDTKLLEEVPAKKDFYNEIVALKEKTAPKKRQHDKPEDESTVQKQQEEMLRQKQREEQERQKRILEQERQRQLREEERRRAKERRRKLLVTIILVLCAIKFVSIQVNAGKDSWKEAYDAWLTPDEMQEKQVYYKLSDMNFDGIPELISYGYTEEGDSYLEICTYKQKSKTIGIEYSQHNVIPCHIGNNVKVYREGNQDVTILETCTMTGKKMDVSEKEKKKTPEPVGLVRYEKGDIASGAYKKKKEDLGYLEPAQSSENDCWDFDMDTAYQILLAQNTPEEVYHKLNVKIKDEKSYSDEEVITFDAKILNLTGNLTYTRKKSRDEHLTNFRWKASEPVSEETLVEQLGLTPMYQQDDFYIYNWNDKLKVKVVYYVNAVLMDFYMW